MKYESDGRGEPMDTIASYFLSKEEREEKTETLGNILYHKVLQCDKDAKLVLKSGHDIRLAKISEE
jgi:hypothetical protein